MTQSTPVVKVMVREDRRFCVSDVKPQAGGVAGKRIGHTIRIS